jgi:outer membrane protein OmpA-like peptidoglycan-associated protein
MNATAVALNPPARQRRALMAACLVFGVADLVFIDLVVLPRVVGDVGSRRNDAPLPTSPAADRGGGGRSVGPLPTSPAADRGGGGRSVRAPVVVEMAVAPLPPAPTLALTIHFNTGESSLSARAVEAVEALAGKVAGQPGWSLLVQGHADARGDAALNERLSHERAGMVAERLGALGLGEGRVRVAAFGATRPLAEGEAPAALRRNRRVEILIVRGEP